MELDHSDCLNQLMSKFADAEFRKRSYFATFTSTRCDHCEKAVDKNSSCRTCNLCSSCVCTCIQQEKRFFRGKDSIYESALL